MTTTTTPDVTTLAKLKRYLVPGMQLKITNHKITTRDMNRTATVLGVNTVALTITGLTADNPSRIEWPRAAGYRTITNGFEYLKPIHGRRKGYSGPRPVLGHEDEPWITFEFVATDA